MKKNLKKAQLALAVAVALGAGFGAAGIASADTVTYTPVYGQVNAGDGSSLAIGSSKGDVGATSALGKNQIAVGIGARATGTEYDTAIGFKALADGQWAIAIGDSTTSSGQNSTAVGSQVTATGKHSLSSGYQTTAAGEDSIALGDRTTTSAAHTIAIGSTLENVRTTSATAENATAIGRGVQASAEQALALGYNTLAKGTSSIAQGDGANALADNSIAIGKSSSVNTAASSSLAIGNGAKVLEKSTTTITKTTKNDDGTTTTTQETTDSTNSLAIGSAAQTAGETSAAIGYNAQADGKNALAVGKSAKASGESTTAVGVNTQVTAAHGTALGDAANVSGENSVAIGFYSKATQKNSTALGDYAEAQAEGAVALGYNTKNSEANTVAVGSRQITQVSAGTRNTDAVNLSQVITDITYENGTLSFKTGADKTTKWSYYIAPTVTAGDSSSGTGTTYHVLNNEYMDKVNNVTSDLDSLKGRVDALEANQGTTGGVDATGSVTTGETNAVSGGNLYSELRPEDGTYVQKDNTTAGNLTALDAAVKANSDAIGDNVSDLGDADKGITGIDGKLIGSAESGYKATLTDGLLAVDEKVGNLNPSSKYTDENGKELGKYNVLDGSESLADNLEAVDTALGDVDSFDSIKDVNGKELKKDAAEGEETGVSVAEAVNAVNNKVGDLAENGNNIAKGQSVNANLASLDSAVGDTSALADTIKDVDGNALAEDKQNVAGYLDAVNSKVGDLDKDAEYSNIEAGASLSDNLASLDSAVGTTKTGAYVDGGKSVGENLNALDDQVFTNTNDIARLGDRLNKVGAGAAALAALHVEDFDADNKLSFAAGFGHYKNANAGAIGVFYKPNHDTTFSVASTVGNGDTMVNAGVSFKLGKSSHVEKTMVAKADYEALQNKVASQDQKLAAQDERLASQDAQIEELKAQVAALVAKG